MPGLCDTYVKNIPWTWYDQHIESPEPTEVRKAKARFDAQLKKVENWENAYKEAQRVLHEKPRDREAKRMSVASCYALVKEHACLYDLHLRLLEAMDRAQEGN